MYLFSFLNTGMFIALSLFFSAGSKAEKVEGEVKVEDRFFLGEFISFFFNQETQGPLLKA